MNPTFIALPPEALLGVIIGNMIDDGLVVTISHARGVVSTLDGELIADRPLQNCCAMHRVLSFIEVVKEAATTLNLQEDAKTGSMDRRVEEIEAWLAAGGRVQAEA